MSVLSLKRFRSELGGFVAAARLWLARDSRSSALALDRNAVLHRAVILGGLMGIAGCASVPPPPTGIEVNRAGLSALIAVDPTPPIGIGESVSLTLVSAEAALGHLYLQSGDGEVTVLGENISLPAGQPLVFPGAGAGFAIQAAPGNVFDRVSLLLTRDLFEGLLEGGPVFAPVPSGLSHAEFSARLQALTSALPRRDWGLSEAIIETARP